MSLARQAVRDTMRYTVTIVSMPDGQTQVDITFVDR
jgi:hypothetical protein